MGPAPAPRHDVARNGTQLVTMMRLFRQDRVFVSIVLAASALAICLRMPNIIIKGRFWAEEGTVFFHNAWVLPPIQALFTSYGGYLNLAANAGTLAARWLLPVHLAPYLTITLALLVQLCPLLLLLGARDGWLRPHLVRLTAVLLVLLVPGVEEIWLQSLHCQFELTLCCGIILALRPEPAFSGAAIFRFMLLLLAPLCGPGAIALLPLLFGRAVLDRDPARFWQTLVLGVGSALQLGLFFHANPNRGADLNLVLLLDIFSVRNLDLPFLGIAYTEVAAQLIEAQRHSGHVPMKATLLPILVFVPFLILTLGRHDSRPAFWLLVGGGIVACASYFGAIGGAERMVDARSGGRYVFVPEALFSLSVLALAATASRPIAIGASAVALWLIVLGGAEYIDPWPFVANGQPWRHEVALWRLDPMYRLHIWPEDWPAISLPSRP